MLHSKRLAALVPFSINQDKIQFFWKNQFDYNEFASGSQGLFENRFSNNVTSKIMITT